MLVLQGDAVRALADGIRAHLRPEVRERLTVVRAISPDVYEAYVKGRYALNQRTRESLQVALKEFTRALELDATYAPAHAALAEMLQPVRQRARRKRFSARVPAEGGCRSNQGLADRPEFRRGAPALGFVHHYEWRWTDAEKEHLRAIELNPNYAQAHANYSNLLMSLRRYDESLRQAFAARELDPFSLNVNTNLGWMLNIGWALRRSHRAADSHRGARSRATRRRTRGSPRPSIRRVATRKRSRRRTKPCASPTARPTPWACWRRHTPNWEERWKLVWFSMTCSPSRGSNMCLPLHCSWCIRHSGRPTQRSTGWSAHMTSGSNFMAYISQSARAAIAPAVSSRCCAASA